MDKRNVPITINNILPFESGVNNILKDGVFKMPIVKGYRLS